MSNSPWGPWPPFPGDDGTSGGNAFTVTTADYTQPAIGDDATITTADARWVAWPGQVIFVAGAGYYVTTEVLGDGKTINATNLGYPGSAAPGATIAAGAQVSPGGVRGAGSNLASAYAALATDETSVAHDNPPATDKLMEIPGGITVQDNARLMVTFEAFVSAGGDEQVLFALYIDGSFKRRSWAYMNPTAASGPTYLQFMAQGLSAGNHTVEIFWSIIGGITAHCDASSNPAFRYASLAAIELCADAP